MFEKHIIDFNENIIGLRDFIDLIDPFLNEKFNEHDKRIKPLITLGILNGMVSEEKEWQDGEKEKLEELKKELNDEIKELYNREIEVEIETDEKDSSDDSEKDPKRAISVKIKTSNAPKDLQNHFENVRKVRDHIELLYKNSFISLLSSVEWFFSQILHYNYDKFPESAGISKKSLTLSDLKTFGSIEDAEKFLIDTKIEEILRGNLESWFVILKSDLNLGLGYIEQIKDELIEIYQRRNLFVHNGGVVNSIYLSKVHDKFKEKVIAGDKLIVDKKYLDNAICKLQKAFILIAAELWKNSDKSDKTRGDVLGDIVYENLLKSKWDICEGLTYFIMNDAQMDVTDKLIAQLNFWLCKKESGQFEEIKKELLKTDYSDKKDIFQLALLALKDDIDSFMILLPQTLESKQLHPEKLLEFPIFKSMRETDKFIEFKENSIYFKTETKE